MVNELTRIDKKAGTLEVLLSLSSSGELKVSDLCRTVRLERGTVARAVSLLQEMNLVSLSESPVFPFTRLAALTPLGSRLARAPLVEWPSIFFEQTLAPAGHSSDLGRGTSLETSRAPSARNLREIPV